MVGPLVAVHHACGVDPEEVGAVAGGEEVGVAGVRGVRLEVLAADGADPGWYAIGQISPASACGAQLSPVLMSSMKSASMLSVRAQ